jgi:hypothetical protein
MKIEKMLKQMLMGLNYLEIIWHKTLKLKREDANGINFGVILNHLLIG